MQTVSWHGECESYRADAGQLDAMMPLYRTIAGSVTIDLQWFAAVIDVGELIKQRHFNEVANASALSRYLASNQREISETIRRGYEDHCRTIDRCNAQFDRYIRGVQQEPRRHLRSRAAAQNEYFLNDAAGEMLVLEANSGRGE